MKTRLFLFLLFFSSILHAETRVMAAGAGYKRPVAELVRSYEKASGHKVEAFYGNMARVLAQARQSGKVSLILGDLDFLQKSTAIDFQSLKTTVSSMTTTGTVRYRPEIPDQRQPANPAHVSEEVNFL